MLNSKFDKCYGISFVDSNSIEVCKPYRIAMHKVFAGITVRSKQQMIDSISKNYI